MKKTIKVELNVTDSEAGAMGRELAYALQLPAEKGQIKTRYGPKTDVEFGHMVFNNVVTILGSLRE